MASGSLPPTNVLSFRTRLALVHQAVIVVVLTLTALGGYVTLSRGVHDQLDAALLALAENESGMLAASAAGPVRIHEVPPGPAPPSFERLDRLVQITDADGQVLARSANLGAARLPTPPALLARLAQGEVVFETLTRYGSEPTRMVSLPVPDRGPGLPRAIQVAGSLDDVNHVVRTASELFVGTGVVLLLAVGTAGALLTQRAFGAIDDVVAQARRIDESNLEARLPHPGAQDEIGRLIGTLNDMLARIAHSFEAQRRFTADASHELRSPLSRLRTELEITLRRPREPGEYVDALRSCLDEVERLTLLVEELLALARLDAGQERGIVEAVALDVVVEEAIQRLAGPIRERGLRIDAAGTSAGASMVASSAARVVLVNLLDNAIKFSPPGGRIRVRLAAEGADAVVRVSDEGPGIEATELPYLFDRFYRGQAARAGSAPGFGLGLALSRAIVEAHGGRIEVENAVQGGATFALRLPLLRSVVAGGH